VDPEPLEPVVPELPEVPPPLVPPPLVPPADGVLGVTGVTAAPPLELELLELELLLELVLEELMAAPHCLKP
jgi:hypothetical protein